MRGKEKTTMSDTQQNESRVVCHQRNDQQTNGPTMWSSESRVRKQKYHELVKLLQISNLTVKLQVSPSTKERSTVLNARKRRHANHS